MEVLNGLLVLLDFLLDSLELPGVLLNGLILLLVLNPLLHQGDLLRIDLFLELVDLVVDDFVTSLDLGDFVFCLGQILAVGVSVRSHRFVKPLLFLQPGFGLHILLLVLGNQVALQLDLFEGVQVLRVGQSSLLSIFLFELVESGNLLLEALQSLIAFGDFCLERLDVLLLFAESLVMNFALSLQPQQFLL